MLFRIITAGVVLWLSTGAIMPPPAEVRTTAKLRGTETKGDSFRSSYILMNDFAPSARKPAVNTYRQPEAGRAVCGRISQCYSTGRGIIN